MLRVHAKSPSSNDEEDIMRVLKWLGILLAVYVGFVVIFETVYLRMMQPTLESTGIPMLVITSTDEDGHELGLRVARFEMDGKLYVSAHHWTQGWYHRAVKYPNVQAEIDGVVADYTAVPINGEEYERVVTRFPIPLFAKILMGFPPSRNILRLDPKEPQALLE